MKTPQFKRTVALLCAALQIVVSPYALANCSVSIPGGTGPGTGQVFSVIDKDGKIEFGKGGCNPEFYAASSLGVAASNLILPKTESSKDCTSYNQETISGKIVSTETKVEPVKVDPTIGFKGAGTRVLPDFQKSTSSLSIGDSDFPSSKTKTEKGSNYGNILVQNGNSLFFEPPVDSTSGKPLPVKIKSLTVKSCNSNAGRPSGKSIGVTFNPGTYYIEQLNVDANCDINTVKGNTDTVTLNILGKDDTGSIVGLALNGSNACYNYTPENCQALINSSKNGSEVWDYMAKEEPKKLQVNVYNGNVVLQTVQFVGGLYIANGKLSGGGGSQTTFIGQVVAQNFDIQNNSHVRFFAKDTVMTSDGTKEETPTRYDDYSLAAPAVTTEVNIKDGGSTDGVAFLAIQREGKTSSSGTNIAGAEGDLAIHQLQDDGNYAPSPTYASGYGGVSWSSKYALIKTDGSTKKTTSTALSRLDTSILDRYFEAAKLNGFSSTAVFARPWRTAPTLVDSTGTSAIFATDDGVLYSVNKNGSLNWGWMPGHIRAVLTDKLPADGSATLEDKKNLIENFHPWGQLRTIRSGGLTYITGTALGGALHFALQLIEADSDAKTSADFKITFLDYREGKTSPGGEATQASTWAPLWLKASTRTRWPYGGDAPVPPALDSTKDKVAYIVDNRLVIRKVDGTTINTDKTLSITPSSNLLYWNKGVLYVGTSNGKLMQLDEEGNATEIEEKGSDGLAGGTWSSNDLTTDPILGVQGSETLTGGKLLLTQTWSGVYAASYEKGNWKLPWYTKVGGSSNQTKDPKVPVLPTGSMLTALPAIAPLENSGAAGAVLVPYTANKTSDGKAGGGLLDSEACTNGSISAWSFGPLDALTGVWLSSSKMDAIGGGSERKQDSVWTGPGEATGITVITYRKSNVTYIGMADTASGIGSTYGTVKKGDDGKTIANNPAPQNATQKHTWAKPTNLKPRLNWRELTNFY